MGTNKDWANKNWLIVYLAQILLFLQPLEISKKYYLSTVNRNKNVFKLRLKLKLEFLMFFKISSSFSLISLLIAPQKKSSDPIFLKIVFAQLFWSQILVFIELDGWCHIIKIVFKRQMLECHNIFIFPPALSTEITSSTSFLDNTLNSVNNQIWQVIIILYY